MGHRGSEKVRPFHGIFESTFVLNGFYVQRQAIPVQSSMVEKQMGSNPFNSADMSPHSF